MADGTLLLGLCDTPVSSPWSGRMVRAYLPHRLRLELAG